MEVANTLIALVAVCFSAFQTIMLHRERRQRHAASQLRTSQLVLPPGVTLGEPPRSTRRRPSGATTHEADPRGGSFATRSRPPSPITESWREVLVGAGAFAAAFTIPALALLGVPYGVARVVRGRKREGLLVLAGAIAGATVGVFVWE